MTTEGAGIMNAGSELVAIGIVRKPHGVRGQCCVNGFGDTLAQVSAPVKLWLGRDEKTAREITVSEIRETPKGFICRFGGCDTMDSAEALRDHLLFCGSGSLPELDKGKHYGFELEGLTVVAGEDGKAIGTVIDVETYPTVDCIDVRLDNGSTVVIAMTPGVVRSVNKSEGTITVSRSAIEELLG
jgi:16S rRNA processing protein RimM